ncbi:hypothetical protein ACJIZ3_003047 [Penstemon smallii]|uniref:Ribosomal protein S10 n=1 Tax=Penstemon smallii TaxID=265156 RepID=A0ABD3U847_9LAMI
MYKMTDFSKVDRKKSPNACLSENSKYIHVKRHPFIQKHVKRKKKFEKQVLEFPIIIENIRYLTTSSKCLSIQRGVQHELSKAAVSFRIRVIKFKEENLG